MCTEHHADGERHPLAARPALRGTRRRFLAGGVGALAGTMAVGLFSGGTAGAQEVSGETGGNDQPEQDAAAAGGGGSAVAATEEADTATPAPAPEAETELWTPAYRNRPSWGADERLRLTTAGEVAYPLGFYPVQKVTVHHTASWTPWNAEDAVNLVQAVYREHVAQNFGDIGYHLLIDPLGTVYEGRYSGGTSFPIYETYPGWTANAPRAINAAHTYNLNAGNIGVALIGDFEENEVSDAAWWSLKLTVAMICANTGLDPLGESRYRNAINGAEATLPNVVAHRHAAGTLCPGQAVVDRFDELRESAAALMARLQASTWLA